MPLLIHMKLDFTGIKMLILLLAIMKYYIMNITIPKLPILFGLQKSVPDVCAKSQKSDQYTLSGTSGLFIAVPAIISSNTEC